MVNPQEKLEMVRPEWRKNCLRENVEGTEKVHKFV